MRPVASRVSVVSDSCELRLGNYVVSGGEAITVTEVVHVLDQLQLCCVARAATVALRRARRSTLI